MKNYLFTSESVSEGHPDKVCDKISDALLDFYLKRDPMARVAIETMATTNFVVVAGEVTCSAIYSQEEIEEVIKNTILDIGYDQEGFNVNDLQIINRIHNQSADIALGVDQDGAGDQGIMFGYAKREEGIDTEYMPLAIYLSHKILKNLRDERKAGLAMFGPDAKSQVTVKYENGKATGVTKIVVSTQHCPEIDQQRVRELVLPIIDKSIPEELTFPTDENILINPTGRFVIGGPDGDTGLTGRKIIVDNYGGYAPHGGGNFQGKDPTKVDRSAAYMARYLAKNIVAADLADEVTIQLSYAIGVAEPLSVFLDCHETEKVQEELILDAIKQIDLTPKGIINKLDLRRPIYYNTAAYGHFGYPYNPETGEYSWEKLDLVEYFKQKCGIYDSTK